MAIRWSGKLSDEVYDTLNRYNRKIKRLEKIGGYITPKTITFKEIVEMSNNRNELKRVLETLRGYNKRGAEKTITLKNNVRLSKYQYDLAKKNQKVAKMKATRRLNYIKKLEVTEYGEKQNLNYYQMGDERILNLQARLKKLSTPLEEVPKQDFREFIDYLGETSRVDYSYRDKTYMNNYFDEMIFNLGYAVGYDKNKIQEMKDKIFNNLSDTQIYKMMGSEEAIRSISDWYSIIHSRYLLNKTNSELVRNEFQELYENLDKIINSYGG